MTQEILKNIRNTAFNTNMNKVKISYTSYAFSVELV